MLLAFKIALIILVALPFIVFAGYSFLKVDRVAIELNRQEKEKKIKEREAAVAAAAALEINNDPVTPGFTERLHPDQAATRHTSAGYTGFIDQNQSGYTVPEYTFTGYTEPEPVSKPAKYEDQYIEPVKPVKKKKTTRRRR